MTSEELIAAGKASREREDRATAAAGAVTVSYLSAGMRAWIDRAKQKWLEGGGFGLASLEQEAEIRAAGYTPQPWKGMSKQPRTWRK